MTRVSAILLSALIAAAPLSAAAQDRGGFRGDRDRSGDRGEMRERRQMSVAEAQSIADGRAPCVRLDNPRREECARRLGYVGQRGSSHVFRYELNGRVTEIAVDAGG